MILNAIFSLLTRRKEEAHHPSTGRDDIKRHLLPPNKEERRDTYSFYNEKMIQTSSSPS